MYDDPPADLPSSVSPDADDRVAPASTEFARSQLPLGDHATTERVCPFLRVIAEDGTPGPPIEDPDPANRCVALHEPVPQSLRQQELVCLVERARQLPALPARVGRARRRRSSGWHRPGP